MIRNGLYHITVEMLGGIDGQSGRHGTIGFTGTHTDEAAEGDGMALAGKQSIRFKSKLHLLLAA